MQVPARATSTAVQLGMRGGFRDRFWAGVNLGSTTPGHLPGEVFARAVDYRRWFPEMAAVGIKVIRVYTLLDPSFYSELRRYNLAHPKALLYVIHGVWIPEERFPAGHDLWDPAVLKEQERLSEEVHGAVFGKLRRAPRRGMASGRWTADISPWVIAWSPRVEWDPAATAGPVRRYLTPATKGLLASANLPAATHLHHPRRARRASTSPRRAWPSGFCDRIMNHPESRRPSA